jgi:hypothetical protein
MLRTLCKKLNVATWEKGERTIPAIKIFVFFCSAEMLTITGK